MLERSFAHQQLRALKWRLPLDDNSKYYLERLERGFEGENEFSEILASYNTCTSIHDFTFEIDGSTRQIDTVFLSNNECILFEVKNYIGDFIYKEDEFYVYHNMQKIPSPVRQVDEAWSKFRELLQRIGVRKSVRHYVVFINEEFHLYNAPDHLSIITRAQLRRVLDNLARNRDAVSDTTLQLKEKLLAHNIKDTRPAHVIYQYDNLKKNVFCFNDGSPLHLSGRNSYTCEICDFKTSVKEVVLETARDFSVLFPTEKITVPALIDFSGGVLTKHNLQKALNEECVRHNKGRGTYYTLR
ncbi:nuclease-related domain-containing protein [Nosocomiicoccus sp. HMSC059G07]|uniref:nuclease-related domain-containing protein n=1 Tax=Nosocomiicoccus sp. HMSC059G07 TaxID=1739531 RepID=UPI0008A24E9F|nr:nuclease-related domain-containing protein [Nosocomiicoccus sp. HMSC059G07]OFO56165.1 hypothetical protein HMPREF3029_02795 [Nosocomiicoccus sp. HMSC059G07]